MKKKFGRHKEYLYIILLYMQNIFLTTTDNGMLYTRRRYNMINTK